MKLFIFFPVFNEGAAAANLLTRLYAVQLELPLEVVIVDDGSSDDSVLKLEERRKECPFTLLQHEENRGLAAALTTGLVWLAEHAAEEDVLVLMDGDDTHDPKLITKMLKGIENGSDLVIASRYRKGASISGISGYRWLLSFGAAFLGILLFRLRGVRDYTCGYRAFRARLLKSAIGASPEKLFAFGEYGFTCSVELLLNLSKFSKRISEVPILLQYDRKITASKMRALRMIHGFFLLWWRRLWS